MGKQYGKVFFASTQKILCPTIQSHRDASVSITPIIVARVANTSARERKRINQLLGQFGGAVRVHH
jgi:hypothetical protein